jgi:hypothetical protein
MSQNQGSDSYPSDYDDLYQKYGTQYGIDPQLLKAQGIQESGLNPDAVGPQTKYGQAIGIAQFLPSTAKSLGIDPTDPDDAIRGQAMLMSQNLKRYGDINGALSAYHGGTNQDNWGSKTADYVQKINARHAQLTGNTQTATTQTQYDPAAENITVGQAQAVLPPPTDNSSQNNEKNLPAPNNPADSGTFTAPETPQQQLGTEIDPDLDLINKEIKKRAATPQSAVGIDPDVDLINKEIQKRQAAAKVAVQPPAPPEPSIMTPGGVELGGGTLYNVSDGEDLAAGVYRGLRNVGESIGNAEAWDENRRGLMSDEDQKDLALAQEMEGQQRAASDKQHGDSGWYKGGQVAGEAAASAPFLAIGGEVLGAGAQALKGVPYLGKAANFLTGNIESNAVRNDAGQLITPATMVNKGVRLASTVPVGATAGAATNALTGDNPVQGAEIGAGVGPAASLIGSGISKLAGKASDKIAPYLQKLQQNLLRDPYKTAAGDLDVQGVQNELTRLGPNATLGDLGPNSQALLGAVAQTPGEGKTTVVDALKERQAGAFDRIKTAVMKGLGIDPGTSFEDAKNSILAQKAQNATPFYDSARKANPSMVSPALNEILSRPSVSSALKDSIQIMRDSGRAVGLSDPELVEQAKLVGSYEPGTGGIAPGLNIQTLDYTKQALDSKYQAAVRAAGGNKSDAYAKGILQAKNDLTTELDKLDATNKLDANGDPIPGSGDYAQGRAIFSKDAQSLNALENGKDFSNNKATLNTEDLKKLSPEDKQLYRLGVAEQTIWNMGQPGNISNKIMGSRNKEDALRVLFPDEKSFKEFATTLDNEKQFAETSQDVLRNSLTNPRINSSADLTVPPSNTKKVVSALGTGAGHIGQMAQRNTVGNAIYAGGFIKNWLTKDVPLSEEDIANLGRLMVTPEGKAEAIKTLTPAVSKKADLLHNYKAALYGSAMANMGINSNQKATANPLQ